MNIAMKNQPQSKTFRVPAQLGSIRKIIAAVMPFVHLADLNDDHAFHCQLAIDEAANNIIRHSYENNPQGMIEISLKASDGELIICLTDFGEPYDPSDINEPPRQLSIDHAEPGGWGLHFMRMYMDEIRYTPGPQGNQLRMIKRRTS